MTVRYLDAEAVVFNFTLRCARCREPDRRLHDAWTNLHASLSAILSTWNGSVADWLASGNRPLSPVGRICFHLVENKGADLPFAFLATYLPESDLAGLSAGKLPHLPLERIEFDYCCVHACYLPRRLRDHYGQL